ncbi:recombinase family protein [Methylophilus sp. 5]|uniref:recombinase family protein n=1 Tax=Methylophilus sp. 5 TaxID=1112274 RepID=UPI00048A9163|nr:recombinase family protein [Methylophilus sp. 5]
MSNITFGYVRVSTDDQTTENQKRSIAERYPNVRWYSDDAVSGAIVAAQRPKLSQLLETVQSGDTVVVAAIDRLGRNTVDVLTTVELMKNKGVSVVSLRENFDLSTPVGIAMLTMLAAMAQLERENIKARQLAGLERARAEGKNLGREKTIDDSQVASWRMSNNASIADTANHFSISVASVKRACRSAPPMK